MSVPPHPPEPGTQAGLPACVRHPGRPTALRCNRCDRPACPDCLVEASVGYQCVDCVRGAQATRWRAVGIAGAEEVDRPLVARALIAVNVLLFVVTAAQAGDFVDNTRSSIYHALSEVPPLIAEGQWWRVLTGGFLHNGPVHLIANMIMLWFLSGVERRLGRVPFAVLYLVSLLGSSAAAYAFDPVVSESVGASGAIFGMMGALVVIALRLKADFHALMNAIAVVVVGVALSFSSGTVLDTDALATTVDAAQQVSVSWVAHLGGLVVGAAVTFGLAYAPAARARQWRVGAVAVVVVAILGLFLVRTPQVLDAIAYCTLGTDGYSCYVWTDG
ncbi:rhomboid family intramembrane serine protease [Actinokineospora enzanensis]|uniref:rhomboid family intramembrane serine protease n=1 Tax=Actinokineospora enzanensis TaxID=155975 RepID=UPI00037DB1A6|nr:rhomboid family intramembrane serine protease [Actinokineospora enzanensis]